MRASVALNLSILLLLAASAVACGDDTDPPPAAVCTSELPSVQIRTCDGEWHDIKSLACGHPLTLVDVGVALEPHCIEATDAYATDPEYAELKAKGLNIIQVFLITEDNGIPTKPWCQKFVEDHKIDFMFAMDPYLDTRKELAPQLPANIVLDAQGEIIYSWNGIIPDDKLAQLKELL